MYNLYIICYINSEMKLNLTTLSELTIVNVPQLLFSVWPAGARWKKGVYGCWRGCCCKCRSGQKIDSTGFLKFRAAIYQRHQMIWATLFRKQYRPCVCVSSLINKRIIQMWGRTFGKGLNILMYFEIPEFYGYLFSN